MCVLSHSVMSNSLQPHGLYPAKLLCPWESPGKNTRVGCHALVQGIFPTHGLNSGLWHRRRILYQGRMEGNSGMKVPELAFTIPKINFSLTILSLQLLPHISVPTNRKHSLFSIFLYLINLIYFIYLLFLAVVHLHCCVRAFSGCSEWQLLFIAVCGLLIAVISLVVHRL